MADPRDPHVEPQHADLAVGHKTEYCVVLADESDVSGVDGEKQEDDKWEHRSCGDADVDGEESGLGDEEEESFECEDEEGEEDHLEQKDQTQRNLRRCILEGGDTETQQVTKHIIARKYVHGNKLIFDEELKYGQSRRVNLPRLTRLRRSVAHRGLIDEVRGLFA